MNGTYGLSKSWVLKIILFTVIVYIFQWLQPQYFSFDVITAYFGLIPGFVAEKGFIWQLGSYMFLHGNPMHLLMNMYGLYIFGVMVEEVWGPKKFLAYYLFCGVGAGVTIFLIGLIGKGPAYYGPTIGASGAVFGLLLAFGMLFPNAELLLFFIVPVRAKYLVIIFGGLELFFELSGGMSNVSHVGHLGGIVFGLIYFVIFERSRWMKRKLNSVVGIIKSSNSGESSIRSIIPKRDPDQDTKKEIIRKLESGGGIDSLTDDEYQFVKYLDIINENDKIPKLCSLDVTDEHISDRQFLEIAKKYKII